MKRLLSFVVLLGLMNVALVASSESSEDLKSSVRRWFDVATQSSYRVKVGGLEDGRFSRQLLPIKKDSEEVQDILGCLAVEYLLRLPQRHAQKSEPGVQTVCTSFGDESILNNKDLAILLGRLCERGSFSDFNLKDSLSIARLIYACEPRIINGLGSDDAQSIKMLVGMNELQLKKLDETFLAESEYTESEYKELMADDLCKPNQYVEEATENKCYDMCKFLVEHGARVDFKISKDGKTCLYTAIKNDDVPTFALLYNAGLHYAKQGEGLDDTVYRHKRRAPKIYQHCVDQVKMHNAQQAGDELMDTGKSIK